MRFSPIFALLGLFSPCMVVARLTFIPLEPHVPCGDGSSAGLYQSLSTSNSKRHVLVVGEGSFCDTDDSCKDTLRKRPYHLSSSQYPEAIVGATVLSDSKVKNPTMYAYNKWFVPYCSQDFFLGAGNGSIGGLVRAGSLHMLGVIDHIRNSTQQEIDELVVVGISAGAMGISNHMNEIREMAQELGVRNLKVILDSPMYYSGPRGATNFDAISAEFVDHSVHPLCNMAEHPVIPEITALPCCLDIHCHIRNGLFESEVIADADDTGEASPKLSFLLLDSSYDVLSTIQVAALPNLGFGGNDDQMNTDASAFVFGQGEFSGSRERAAIETLFRHVHTTEQPSPAQVIWAVSTCLTHPFLVPTSLESDLCHLKVDDTPQFTDCGGDAFRVVVGLKITDGLKVGVANSALKWEHATVGGHTIKNLIEGFVDSAMVESSPSWNMSLRNGLAFLSDDCSGPNCVPANSTTRNACQDYKVIQSSFRGVPFGLQIFLAVFVFFTILGFFMRYSCPNCFPSHPFCYGWRDDSEETVERTVGVKMEKLSVYTKSGDGILFDVSFALEPGTVTGLLGPSGSGKSTVLGAVSGQIRPGVVIETTSDLSINIASTTYLRQYDNVALENLTPQSFLTATADIYGTVESVLRMVCGFVKVFFPKRSTETKESELSSKTKESDESENSEQFEEEKKEEEGEQREVEDVDDFQERLEQLPDPFETTQIKSCSGGQRRVLAVGAALLTGPTVLLLDEPLSGLDSVASDRLMDLLRKIARQHDLTILLTLHQPSDDILGYLDKAIVMKDGRIIMDEAISTVASALDSKADGTRVSEFIHEVVKKGDIRASMKTHLDSHRPPNMGSSIRRVSASLLSLPTSSASLNLRHLSSSGSIDDFSTRTSSALSQVFALSRRLRLEYGNNWTDLWLLPCCYAVTAFVLSWRAKSPFQILLACGLFLYLPVLIFQHHNPLALQIWTAHRTELDDRRISVLSFGIANFAFTMSMPLLSVIIAYPIAFGIMNWDFKSFVTVYLFAALYLLLMFSVGRCLMLAFWGKHVYWKIFLLFLFLNVIFSGLLASPGSAPDAVVWIFALDFTFWTLSGSLLTLFEKLSALTDGVCRSFAACLLANKSLVSEATGFTFLSSPFRAILVLMGVLVCLWIAEFLLLRSRRTHFVDPSKVVKPTFTIPEVFFLCQQD